MAPCGCSEAIVFLVFIFAYALFYYTASFINGKISGSKFIGLVIFSPLVCCSVVVFCQNCRYYKSLNRTYYDLLYRCEKRFRYLVDSNSKWRTCPWVRDGKVYALTKRGHLIAINLRTGRQALSCQLSSLGVFGASDGNKDDFAWTSVEKGWLLVKVASLRNGSTKRIYKLERAANWTSHSIKLAGDSIFVHFGKSTLYCLNVCSGEVVWKTKLNRGWLVDNFKRITSELQLARGSVFVGTTTFRYVNNHICGCDLYVGSCHNALLGKSEIHKISTINGAVLGSKQTQGHIFRLLDSNGDKCCTTDSSFFYYLELLNGRSVLSRLWLKDWQLCQVKTKFASSVNTVLNGRYENNQIEATINRGYAATGVIGQGVKVFWSRNEKVTTLTCCHVESEKVLWRHHGDKFKTAKLCIAGECIYIVTNDMKLSCYDISSGRLLWSTKEYKE